MSTWESCYRHTLLSVIWSYNKGNNFKHPLFRYSPQSMFLSRVCYFLTHYQNQNYQNVSFILQEVIKCIYLFESIFQIAYPYSHLSSQKKMANLEHGVLYKKICNTFIFNKSFMYFVTNRKKIPLCHSKDHHGYFSFHYKILYKSLYFKDLVFMES